MNKAYALIGLAQRAGAVASGETAVTAALRRGSAKLVIVAEDASPQTEKRIVFLAKRRNIPCVRLGTRERLGHAIGKSPRAALTIQRAEFARAISRLVREEN